MTTLPAFTEDERSLVHRLLALKVARMMGRKMEEGDWADVYCAAKGIPQQGWSNLNIDVMHGNLGVEHKMLLYKSKPTLDEACGTSLMHPSLTRSIRIPDVSQPADRVMTDVFEQYAELVNSRACKVAEVGGVRGDIDMRTGWLLWQESLRQFLYFEERMAAPDPTDYVAEWKVSKEGGVRKGSKNLWIYERQTGRKRYSVTTSAGIKIQPYFDVPPPTDPNLLLVTVIGEQLTDGTVRVWVTRRTAAALEKMVGRLDTLAISDAVLTAARALEQEPLEAEAAEGPDEVVPLVLTQAAYAAFVAALPSQNDDHGFQLLLDYLSTKGK